VTYFVTTDTWQRRGLFRAPAIASIVENAIFHYRDQGNYLVHRHVVMPDHLHLIVTPGSSTTLEKSIQLIKGGSSHEIGKREGMRFPVWHAGFTEHQIRDQQDFDSHSRYIDENPVKAHLAENAGEYPWGSAAEKFALDAWPVASGAKAPPLTSGGTAGLKPRPSVSSREGGGERVSGPKAPPLTSDGTAGLKPRPSVSSREGGGEKVLGPEASPLTNDGTAGLKPRHSESRPKAGH
jgi:putative transposase